MQTIIVGAKKSLFCT